MKKFIFLFCLVFVFNIFAGDLDQFASALFSLSDSIVYNEDEAIGKLLYDNDKSEMLKRSLINVFKNCTDKKAKKYMGMAISGGLTLVEKVVGLGEEVTRAFIKCLQKFTAQDKIAETLNKFRVLDITIIDDNNLPVTKLLVENGATKIDDLARAYYGKSKDQLKTLGYLTDQAYKVIEDDFDHAVEHSKIPAPKLFLRKLGGEFFGKSGGLEFLENKMQKLGEDGKEAKKLLEHFLQKAKNLQNATKTFVEQGQNKDRLKNLMMTHRETPMFEKQETIYSLFNAGKFKLVKEFVKHIVFSGKILVTDQLFEYFIKNNLKDMNGRSLIVASAIYDTGSLVPMLTEYGKSVEEVADHPEVKEAIKIAEARGRKEWLNDLTLVITGVKT